MATININVGLLGHVDSGKTSLAKCLSSVSSTACFDKNPQSQERGITIDLGFSSFIVDLPDRLKNDQTEKVEFTLVDCPGHASLIRTIIGGSQIIDIMILVVDITKGIQTQTAECLIIGEITGHPLLVALNKIDLIEPSKQLDAVQKAKKKMQATLANTTFKGSPIIAIAAKPGGCAEGLTEFIEILREMVFIPERNINKPLIYSVDHCFTIKGKGTIMTGTVLQGTIKVNDSIEIPALQTVKKVKSIQIYKSNVAQATQGDRIGICVTQFDPKLLERGVACLPGFLSPLFAIIISLTRVKYYKLKIASGTKFHISIGYDTVLGKLTLFSNQNCENPENFCFDHEYELENEVEEVRTSQKTDEHHYALIEFEKSVVSCKGNIVIGSRLDVDVHTTSCRIAFHGKILVGFHEKNYYDTMLSNLKIFKIKQKVGSVQRIVNEHELIAQSLFKKESKIQLFLNFKVTLTSGENGIIESSFGQSGKVKIRIPEGLKSETLARLDRKINKNKSQNEISAEPIKILLRFKKFIFGNQKLLSSV